MAEAAVQEGQFEAMVHPHLDYLYAMAVRLCGDRVAAEDLVQDALLRAFRGYARLRNREHPRLWLVKVLTSSFYDRLRRERRAVAAEVEVDEEFDLFDRITEEDPFPYSDRVHLDFLDLFDDVKLIEVLQRVHPSHRVALILAYVYGFAAREIGTITGKPLGTVLSWLHRGRKQLERELWEYATTHHLLTPHVEGQK